MDSLLIKYTQFLLLPQRSDCLIRHTLCKLCIRNHRTLDLYIKSCQKVFVMSVNHQSKCATVVASAVIVVTVLILLQYSISVPLFFYMVLICKPHQPIELSILSHLGKMNLMRRTEGTSIFIVPKMIHTGLKNRFKYFRIFSKVKKLFKYANHRHLYHWLNLPCV